MKKLFYFLIIMAIGVFITSCEETKPKTADKELKKQTENAMQEANRQVGYPAIVNFQEKKLMKQIYELRDQEKLICYAYIVDMHGNLHFIGKCIGYGLPYSTQFSNPLKAVDMEAETGVGISGSVSLGTLPQPEPNGLFMPEGLAAT